LISSSICNIAPLRLELTYCKLLSIFLNLLSRLWLELSCISFSFSNPGTCLFTRSVKNDTLCSSASHLVLLWITFCNWDSNLWTEDFLNSSNYILKASLTESIATCKTFIWSIYCISPLSFLSSFSTVSTWPRISLSLSS